MQKSIFLFFILFFLLNSSKAGLSILNNTSYTISYAIFCHDNINTYSSFYQGGQFNLTEGIGSYFPSTNEIGPCFAYGYNSQSAFPGVSQGWDAIKFYISNGAGFTLGSIGICCGVSSTSFGVFTEGGGSVAAFWNISPNGNHFVTFN